ncbi:MAG: hypothetical protein HYT08_04335 [Candidatus Levybacteria bacterium]|nr:hypothetical protein [Candidatus Levybacteria bacterium]
MKYKEKYKDCLEYIESYWNKIIRKPARQKINNNFITIPNHFLTPNDKKFSYIFYWDSFFMFRGLMGTKKEWLMKDMVENFVFLFNRYHIIPNLNSHAAVNRSQPPFLTSMILDAYKTFNNGNGSLKGFSLFKNLLLSPRATFGNINWLREKMEIAKKEYDQVWNNNTHYNHFVKKYSLNRYGDRDIGYAHSSELESGWDFTSRFYNRCNEFLPIDLNCYLYKYEKDFELVSSMLGDKDEADYWQSLASKRKNIINRLMWNEKTGFFFDFGHHFNRQSNFYSLAGFVPLWTELASFDQAKKMVSNLKHFESDYGLFITSEKSIPPKIDLSKIPTRFRPAIEEIVTGKQWDFPNIWPPLEYLTVIGLLKYGFIEEARKIMEKSVAAHAGIYRKYKTFFERIDGATGDKPKNSQYPIQSGFGWTNAIFFRYIRILDDLENGKNIYTFPKEEAPPFDFSILN